MTPLRFRTILGIGAAVALLLLPASGAAQTSYTLRGVETSANPATFVGLLVGQVGTWQAIIQHQPLNNTPGGTTAITGGVFSISPSGAPTVGGTITSGLLQAGPVVGSFFCTQSFVVSGNLANATSSGVLGGVLTHFGVRSGPNCNAFFATFAGSAAIG
jgi:hypothetical protein